MIAYTETHATLGITKLLILKAPGTDENFVEVRLFIYFYANIDMHGKQASEFRLCQVDEFIPRLRHSLCSHGLARCFLLLLQVFSVLNLLFMLAYELLPVGSPAPWFIWILRFIKCRVQPVSQPGF